GDAEALEPGEVLTSDLLLDVGLGHGKDLAVRAHEDGGLAGGLDRVEHRRQQPRRGRRPELVVDDHRDPRRRLEKLREAGTCVVRTAARGWKPACRQAPATMSVRPCPGWNRIH